MKVFCYLLFGLLSTSAGAQDFGSFPTITKAELLRDLDLLYQGLDQYHSGMYWYTPKDSVDMAFEQVKAQIDRDMNVLEFHRLIAPLVGLSREDHTDIFLPETTRKSAQEQATFFPFTVVFLGKQLYVVRDGSSEGSELKGREIVSINGLSPVEIVEKTGALFASDGFIKRVKYSDLEGFDFSRYYYYYFGMVDTFEIRVAGSSKSYSVKPLKLAEITQNLTSRNTGQKKANARKWLEFRLVTDSIAYLGIHTFSNDIIRKSKLDGNYKKFLEEAFASISKKNIRTLVIDLSKNGGGTEGNENLLYSYVADNYQKYLKVRAKAQRVILDNGIDKPIKLKTFGFLEKTFANKRQADGSYERSEKIGHGLMAYKRKPAHRFDGQLYVIISPVTYSGASEFSNMAYTNERGVFVGQETGGGFHGNTSGYSSELTLPHSEITIDLPALQFVMNVDGLPFGSGVIPHYEVIPTFEQYVNGENASLKFILELEEAKQP